MPVGPYIYYTTFSTFSVDHSTQGTTSALSEHVPSVKVGEANLQHSAKYLLTIEIKQALGHKTGGCL